MAAWSWVTLSNVPRRNRRSTLQLVLAEAALQPEQQPIFAVPGRLNGLLVDQYVVDLAAYFDQLVRVPVLAHKARNSTAHTTRPCPGRLRRPFEGRPLSSAGRRATEIVVDHFDLRPTHRCQAISHGTPQHVALSAVQNLMSQRLPHMEQRLATTLRPNQGCQRTPVPGSSTCNGAKALCWQGVAPWPLTPT
jgi:hypothetical protein